MRIIYINLYFLDVFRLFHSSEEGVTKYLKHAWSFFVAKFEATKQEVNQVFISTNSRIENFWIMHQKVV